MLLGNTQKGSIVSINGRTWDVLADVEGGVLCLHHDILCEKEFDENNCNNWEKSSIRSWLNRTFLDRLKAEMGGQKPVKYCSNLVTDDGLEDYGMSEDRVFLLTAEQYRKYRRFISEAKGLWWLITANSTCNNLARIVNADGSLGYYFAYYGSYGVRPACVFSSSVEVDELENDYRMSVKLRCKPANAEKAAKTVVESLRSVGCQINESDVEVHE